MSPLTVPATDMWIITTFFNPNGYRSKYRNFDRFRRHLQRDTVPLMVVECTFGDAAPEIADSAADVVIRAQTNSILWQKERLLNLALEHLPDSCTKILWLDADIVFQDPEWLTKAAQSLETAKVVQLFSEAIRLEQHTSIYCNHLKPAVTGFVHHVKTTGDTTANYETECGFAWGAQRSVLDGIGFYDRNIIGAADWYTIQSFLGQNTASDWAKEIGRRVDRSVDCLPGTIIHLFHGSVNKRLYPTRGQLVSREQFNPDTQLRINESGAYELVKVSKSLQKGLIDYFAHRDEDEPLRWSLLTKWYWWLEINRASRNPLIRLQLVLKDAVGSVLSRLPQSLRRSLTLLVKQR